MLQRIAGIVITILGLVLAIVIGFWALVFLALFGVVAMLMYLVRTRLHSPQHKTSKGRIIEGEFEVLDDGKVDPHAKKDTSGNKSGSSQR